MRPGGGILPPWLTAPTAILTRLQPLPAAFSLLRCSPPGTLPPPPQAGATKLTSEDPRVQRGGRGPAWPRSRHRAVQLTNRRRGPWSPGPGQPWHGAQRERVTRSHATSRQRGSGRAARGQGQGRREGAPQGRAPQEHLFRGPFTSYGSSRQEDLPRARPPCRTQETPRAPHTGAWRPLLDRNVSSRDSEGTPCSSRPPASGLQTSPGSRQDRQPQVRAKTVPSTRGQGAAPSLPGHLPERCRRGAGGVLRMPWGRGTRGGQGTARPLQCPLLRPSHPGSSRKQEG